MADPRPTGARVGRPAGVRNDGAGGRGVRHGRESVAARRARTLRDLWVLPSCPDSVDDEWLKICSACGRVDAALPPSDVDVSDEDDKGDDNCPGPPPGECIEIEDFGIYLTPSQAATLIEAAGERLQADEAAWSNRFAVADGEGGLADAHRLAFREVRLAAVQLVETRSASRRAVAAGFGVKENSLWR